MQLPTIVIVTAAAREDVRAIWDAMGQGGPATFLRKLCDIDPLADPTTAATHYLLADMGADSDMVADWQAMVEGAVLPPILGVWGEDGVISEAAAVAAVSNGNLQVYSAAGVDQDTTVRDQWAAGILAGRQLQFVPAEEA
jgi:hypothetical protein